MVLAVTLRALALAAVLVAAMPAASDASCIVGTLVCTSTREIAGITGPWCIGGSIGQSGHWQTAWC